jgi:hypothetical protein
MRQGLRFCLSPKGICGWQASTESPPGRPKLTNCVNILRIASFLGLDKSMSKKPMIVVS